MYELNDTIAAVSSADGPGRVIIRLTGPRAFEEVGRIFSPLPAREKAGIFEGFVTLDERLKIDAKLYMFVSPNSYTGEDVAEIHVYTNPSVAQAVIYRLLSGNTRMAGAGEFTARSYLNGKIDLAQAEAVNEIIAGSNRVQLAAAEKLLEGKLTSQVSRIAEELTECLSLIEVTLDFSGEDIEFITSGQAAERLSYISDELAGLLAGSIEYETIINLPSVGLTGAPNAGKSSLANRLLGKERSIVSGTARTTRDILTSRLSLENSNCILFDSAGILCNADGIIEKLSCSAALEAISKSDLAVFCVDVSKKTSELDEDIAVRHLINPKRVLAVAAKADLLEKSALDERLEELARFFGMAFLPTSAKTGFGIETLKAAIDKILSESLNVCGEASVAAETAGVAALTARHKNGVCEAIENISQAVREIQAGNDEIAAMLLRAACGSIGDIEQNIDDAILENIFSRFCIGK